MATIKPIEGRSVHQIQSGQVIVDLQSVCKELVENSIDAGATSIEVRFKNNGLDSIEVQDNGSGIAPDDYQTIALKHYTSKLSSYHDLSSLQTFGFRGEALSSLCALSNFHIITARPADGPKGTKLEFEQSGKLKGTSVVAAKQGTTVVVETLFYNLPVRRKELEKNIKREYNKVLQLLNAYACISVGVKFSVSNLMPKGKKSIAFSTNLNSSTRDNISNVYGAKTVAALIPLDLAFEMNSSTRPMISQNTQSVSHQDESGSRAVKIVGHISRPVVGEGRQTPDRQMFFVNSRPCNLPQVAKAFNEVYKSYNVTQLPFVFADIILDTNAYDVNVSPDKRTIMLHDQTALLETLKEPLLELFQSHDQSVPQAQLLEKRSITSAFKAPSFVPRANASTVSAEVVDEDENTPEPINPIIRENESPSSDGPESMPRPGFVKASLIERFATRDAQERTKPHAQQRKNTSREPTERREQRQSRSTSRYQSASPEREMEREETRAPVLQRSSSPLFEPEKNASPVPIRSARPPARSSTSSPIGGSEDEDPIPAIRQTTQNSSQSSIQNAFDRMRPMRTPVQQATITVGDITTVSTVGHGSESRAAKRARIHTPKFSLSGKPLRQSPNQPLILKSLRAFAAPGTQHSVSDDENDSDEDEGEQEENYPDLSARTPSSRKRIPQAHKQVTTGGRLISSTSASPGSTSAKTPGDVSPDSEVEGPEGSDASDAEYIDEKEKKAREEAKIAQLIAEAEESAAQPTEANLKRAGKLFKVSQNKYQTVNLEHVVQIEVDAIARYVHILQSSRDASTGGLNTKELNAKMQLSKEDPEERLSLTVTKKDFNEMRIIGQFNLGFIIAVRPPNSTSPTADLFIIDQHASDEKYNFERLSATTTLVSQRLVHAHPLELTAVEEELILANEHALSANGFVVEMDTTSDLDSGHRAKLTSLPMSKEVTFTPADLEELLALIFDNPPSSSMSTSTHIPRPSKVRKLLASRACRSSVMIGKTLQNARMKEIVRHMGSMDKPWSCPHGRPTMRHLYGLEKWEGWKEGDGVLGADTRRMKTDWKAFLDRRKA